MALRSSRAKIEKHIERREAFKIGNVSAIRAIATNYQHEREIGRLPIEWVERLKSDNRRDWVYVVYSYQTPIGWTKGYGEPEWTIPDEKYSPTTTNHQSVLMYSIRGEKVKSDKGSD